MKNDNIDRNEMKKATRGRLFQIILALSSHAGNLLGKATSKIGAYYVGLNHLSVCWGVDRVGFYLTLKNGGAHCRH